MKMLVVEDDFVCRKLMRLILSPHGECDMANDGNEAIEAFTKAHDNKTPYNLVCLDVMMPGMDGHDVLRKMRELEGGWGVAAPEGVKVIMTTAVGEKESVLGAFKTGCEAYMVKPIDKNKLLAKIREMGLIKS